MRTKAESLRRSWPRESASGFRNKQIDFLSGGHLGPSRRAVLASLSTHPDRFISSRHLARPGPARPEAGRISRGLEN